MKKFLRSDFEKIYKLKDYDRKPEFDIYHVDDWDHRIKDYSNSDERVYASNVDFFFDSKDMTDFLKEFLRFIDFDKCYILSLYHTNNKIAKGNSSVENDIYEEYKIMLNSVGLSVNTFDTVQMTKDEIINWCKYFSVAGFMGISNFSLIIPKADITIIAHHHMNYLIYSDLLNKEFVKRITNNHQDIKMVCC